LPYICPEVSEDTTGVVDGANGLVQWTSEDIFAEVVAEGELIKKFADVVTRGDGIAAIAAKI